MNEIRKTRDYHIFQKLLGNRHIDKYHLKKLQAAIQKDNQLSVHPIIVNKDFYVIDGQHRLAAAKELGVDIYYIQSDTVSDFHVIDGNVNQKTFEVENYIDYFAIKERNPVYIELKRILKETGLKPKALITLLLGTTNASILDFLKTGKFQFPANFDVSTILSFYLEFVSYTKDKRIKPTSIFTNHNFTRAFRWLHNTKGFDSALFFKKLDLQWFVLKPQRTAEEWYNLLLTIYNYKNHNKLNSDDIWQ